MAYWGMDICGYPGDSIMANWAANSPYYYTGFYLSPAPCDVSGGTWMSKRSFLAANGWGFIPIFAGRQASSNNLTASQGQIDANQAASDMSTAGFPSSSYVYLDIEQGGTLSQSFINYIVAWVKQINHNSSYWSGIYCSYNQTADQINTALGSESCKFWIYNLNYDSSKAGLYDYGEPDPSGCGVSYAYTWQLAQNVSRTFGSNTLSFDINTSNFKDPSRCI